MPRVDIVEGHEPCSFKLIHSGGKQNQKHDAIDALQRATAGRADSPLGAREPPRTASG